ncbi:hypothetical protein Bbelb_179600 [Branchiostoma belcheri]|nr:hypothetical protein Bbelb_179600 [Branchiostoma belcheri]
MQVRGSTGPPGENKVVKYAGTAGKQQPGNVDTCVLFVKDRRHRHIPVIVTSTFPLTARVWSMTKLVARFTGTVCSPGPDAVTLLAWELVTAVSVIQDSGPFSHVNSRTGRLCSNAATLTPTPELSLPKDWVCAENKALLGFVDALDGGVWMVYWSHSGARHYAMRSLQVYHGVSVIEMLGATDRNFLVNGQDGKYAEKRGRGTWETPDTCMTVPRMLSDRATIVRRPYDDRKTTVRRS